MNIYVGNLSADTTEDELREAFAAFGEVTSARIVRDGTTSESRGFGFVEMPDEQQATAAVQQMNGKELKGSQLKVEPGRSRPVAPRSGGRPGGPGRRPGGGGRPGGRSSGGYGRRPGGRPGGSDRRGGGGGGGGGGRGPSRGNDRRY